MNGEQRPGWHFAHAQDLRILRMLKGTFRLTQPNYGVLLQAATICNLTSKHGCDQRFYIESFEKFTSV